MTEDNKRKWQYEDSAEEMLEDERWNADLEPAKKVLKEFSIRTVGELKRKTSYGTAGCKEFKMKLSEHVGSYGWGELLKFLRESTSIQPVLSAEQTLHKKILDTAGRQLSEEIAHTRQFMREAIAVKFPDHDHRQYDIHIVQGPSGSGKTVFAINDLAFLSKKGDKADLCSCVYYSLGEHADSDYTPTTFVDRIGEVLKAALTAGSKWQWDPNSKTELKMRVSLILDEAGTMDTLLNNKMILEDICGEIGKYAEHPRLILAGTGYNKILTGFSSYSDIRKYWMQPWDEDKLASVAAERYPENGKRYVEEIGKYPMLKRLITNARAAVFTLDAVNDLNEGHPIIKLQGCIGAVIQIVIGRYTTLNGISKLSERQRKALAYAVFHELDQDNRTDKPRFPEFGTLSSLEEGERLEVKRQAQGVMDLHVEACCTEDGRVSTDFVDDQAWKTKRSVSITPVMSMILYNLLGVDATIYDNWDGLEVTTALHAVYLETLSNTTTQEKGVCLARLTKAVPPLKATKQIHIPSQADTPTIFINGEEAPFCNVITNFRGLQVKHAKNGEECDLHLGEELQKCGLLKTELPEVMLSGHSVDPPADATDDEQSMEASADDDDDCEEEIEIEVAEAAATAKDNGAGASAQANTDKDKEKEKSQEAFRMGNAMMGAFLHTWKNAITATSEDDANAKESNPIAPRFLSPAFCFPTSGRADTEVVPSLRFTVAPDGTVRFKKQKIPPVEFDGDSPFDMIFVTNAKQIQLLPKPNNGPSIVIGAADVDVDGALTSKPDGYEEYLGLLQLKENVNIRFVFTGQN